MELISLKTLIYDILNLARGGNPIDDEPISERQIEYWIHLYRAFFLRRDLDKSKVVNPDYIQNINSIPLEYDSNKKMYKTGVDIPNTLDLGNKSGITFIGDKFGNQIQLTSEKRVNWQRYTKWTRDNTLAYLNNKRIFIYNSKGLDEISIRGIFENPVEAAQANGEDYDYDSVYPIPMSLVPVIKEEILRKELSVLVQAPDDEVNDANNTVTPE